MINKRLLVKALLSHHDENSFYDKKVKLTLSNREGKAKFLKHICALSNSNPTNNSFIVVGVTDQSNTIVGVDFFDDSKLQNLLNAYLDHPPSVLYENIPFPHLPKGKVVGLVTIRPLQHLTALSKNIWKYPLGTVFFREGSRSVPRDIRLTLQDYNSSKVNDIERHAQNNIRLTLDGVFDFMQQHQGELESHYRVFKETFVVCWSGLKKEVKQRTYYSRVDIELINEQVQLFYSNFDEVEIDSTEDAFIITEYVCLVLNDKKKYYPLEEVKITFEENGSYRIESQLLFDPPKMDNITLLHLFNTNNTLLKKLEQQHPLNAEEKQDLSNLCSVYMLCILHKIPKASSQFEKAKPLLKHYKEELYLNYKHTQRILRKVKYN